MPNKSLTAALTVALAAGAVALTGPANAAAPKAATADTSHPGDPSTAAEIRALRATLAEQRARLDAQQAELDALQRKLQARAAGTPAAAAQPQPANGAQVAQAQATPKPAPPAPPSDTATSHTKDTGITLGGAVRFQYTTGDYNRGINRRKGDMQFDIFRLDLHGKVHGILLDAQWRWFTYMSAVQHAWVGYDFDPHQQLQIGLTRIPFGNQPFDSHSYFFSSNYYLGLEDTYGFGAQYVYAGDAWNVQVAFLKNDATGAVDGSTDRTHSYSYDIVGVRSPGEGTFAAPAQPAGAVDTIAARVARTFKPLDGLAIEVGVSGMYGGIDTPDRRIGHHSAGALFTSVDYGRWNFQAQAAHYDYHTDQHATQMAVGAYAFYDSIAARANSYTLNARYHQPVHWGPIEGLDFYNDYSLVTDKSGGLPNTFMDVLGVGVSAGDLYTYFDFVTARNQPFIGGSMAGDGGVDHRLNINFGFYF